MNDKAFWYEVLAALVLACGASLLVFMLQGLVSYDTAMKVMLMLLALSYLGYLMWQIGQRRGRLVISLGIVLLASSCLLLNLTLAAWLAWPLLAIWLIRSLYRYNTLVSIGMDLLLNLLALSAALAALSHSHSAWLAVWTFFLLQSLACFIPGRRLPLEIADQAQFERAHSLAEASLRRLAGD